jgi:hypothetical protein
MSYPITPTLSVEAVHDRSTRPEEIATAPRPDGSLGLVTSLDAPVVTTSCGLFVASREEKSTPSLDVPARTKLYVPSPGTSDVTLKSTQAPDGTEALSSTPDPERGVRLAHVIVVSDHVLSVV